MLPTCPPPPSDKKNHDFITELMTVNTLSYIWMATHALPALEKSAGQILVISSFAGEPASQPVAIVD